MQIMMMLTTMMLTTTMMVTTMMLTCFSRVLFGTMLTSKTQRKPSMLHFPSGINRWSNSFSIPGRTNGNDNRLYYYHLIIIIVIFCPASNVGQADLHHHHHIDICTKLVFADVHKFLRGLDPSVGASSNIRLLLPARSERLKQILIRNQICFTVKSYSPIASVNKTSYRWW